VNSINGMPNILGGAVPFYILEQTSLLFDVHVRANLIDDLLMHSYPLNKCMLS